MAIAFNQCLPAFETDVHGNNIQAPKKLIVLEIFLIYLIYLAVITIGTLKDRYKENGKYSDGAEVENMPQEKRANLALVEKLNYYMFDRFFYSYFGLHTIAIGTVLLYAPYGFELVIVWLHFVLFLVMLGLKVKFGEEKNRFLFIMYGLCQLMNIILIFSSLISLGAEKNCSYALISSASS